MSSMWPDNFIFQVKGSNLKDFGTCFAIHSDAQFTYFLSCAHVIEDVGGSEGILVDNIPAELVVSDSASGYDVAVLRTNRMEVSIFSLSVSGKQGQLVSLNGFYTQGPQTILRPIRGSLTEPGKISSTSFSARPTCWNLSVESEQLLQKGYSGSPVYDEQQKCIIGIVNQRKGNGQQGQVISVEVLKIIWSEYASLLFTSVPVPRLTKNEGPLINFEKELTIFRQIIDLSDVQTRLIVLHGKSAYGKSRLIREFKTIAEAGSFQTLNFDLKMQIDVEQCLEAISKLPKQNNNTCKL